MASSFPSLGSAASAASGVSPTSTTAPQTIGDATFSSAGIQLGSKVVGGGKASTDQSTTPGTTSGAAQAAITSTGSPAWYAQPAAIIALAGVGVLMLVGFFVALRRPAPDRRSRRR